MIEILDSRDMTEEEKGKYVNKKENEVHENKNMITIESIEEK